ncbi:hypothetical protein [Candidatus Methylacidithermus pantelleriae]|nr:hypothetical protein [Candidatus Methylacidithermus pantelleriae]
MRFAWSSGKRDWLRSVDQPWWWTPMTGTDNIVCDLHEEIVSLVPGFTRRNPCTRAPKKAVGAIHE